MLSRYATTISKVGDETLVTYHSTVIVRFNEERVILNSGGWRTATTKKKMNQAAIQFDLPYGVFQRDHEWYVDNTYSDISHSFQDGMIISRRKP